MLHRCTRFENLGGGSMRFLPNFWREGIQGLWKFWGEGTPFWCFIAFLLPSFAKNLEGGYTLSPITHPPPPPCASMPCSSSLYKSSKIEREKCHLMWSWKCYQLVSAIKLIQIDKSLTTLLHKIFVYSSFANGRGGQHGACGPFLARLSFWNGP